MFARLFALFLLFATPAYAQAGADQQSLADALIGERISAAVDLCLAPSAEISSIEAQAQQLGWPAFEDAGRAQRRWRASNIRVGEGVIASFGILVGEVPDVPPSVTGVNCKFIVPSAIAGVLRQRLTAKFPSDDGDGFFYLEGGALRELTLMEMLDNEVPEMMAAVTDQRRLVIVITEGSGGALVAEIATFRPAAEQ